MFKATIIILAAILSFSVFAGDFTFSQLCSAHFKQVPNSAETCAKIDKLIFKGNKKDGSIPFSPSLLGVQTLPLDRKIQYVAFKDPNFVTGVAYCYSIFRKWIEPKRFGPDQFAEVSSGFAILNKLIDEYQTWLTSTKEGKNCQALVEKTSGVPVINLKRSLKGYSGIVAINPFASMSTFGKDYDAIVKDMKLTVAHERIHVFQMRCPSFLKWGVDQWNKLAAPERHKFANNKPQYNWNDTAVAVKEYPAYILENDPDKVEKLLEGCD